MCICFNPRSTKLKISGCIEIDPTFILLGLINAEFLNRYEAISTKSDANNNVIW